MKKKIALILAAALILASCGFVFTGCKGKSAKYMIDLLKNTKINMSGVTAFGIAQKTGGASAKAVNFSTRQTAKKEEFNQILVTVSENGKIEEVIFRDTDANKEILQDKIGNVTQIYVATEFTFIQYSMDKRYESTFICGGKHQTFAIHHETGKIYPLDSLRTLIYRSTDDEFPLIPFDGGIRLPIDNGLLLKMSVDAELNLVFEDILPNKNIAVRSIIRDFYGNFYIQNTNIDQKIGNILYYTANGTEKLFHGSDGRMYFINSDWKNFQIGAYNADLEKMSIEDNIHVALIMDIEFFIIQNNYLFFSDGRTTKLENGQIESLERWRGDDLTSANFYILEGVLLATLPGRIMHIDLSTYNETDSSVTINDIVEATFSYINGKAWIATQETLTGTKKYIITVENGKPICELLSEMTYNGGQLISIQPLN